MLPKLGIVSIGVHRKYLDWVAHHKPVSALIINERGQSRPERPWENNEIDMIRAAMAASPKTLWIFRSWPDGIGEGTPLAPRIIKCFEPFMDMPNPKMGHSYNEPGFPWIRTSGDARQLTALEMALGGYMHGAGLLSMNFCFSESHLLKGNMGLWSIFAEALPYIDALGFNEYDWPSVFTSRDQGYKWRIGHWEHQVERIAKELDRWGIACGIPPIIIGEGILDGKIKYPHPHGWQKQGGNLKWYVKTHQDAHDDTYHRPEVFSHNDFCYCHPSSEWRSYSVEPILDDLGPLVRDANPKTYWEDYKGGGSVEQPIRVLIESGEPSIVVPMELEEYLRGVLPNEMGREAPLEALKAQAVAARCYALNAIKHPRHKEKKADICTTTHCQVWTHIDYPETDKAIRATKGIVATHNGEVINAFYFGHCDGHTRNSEDVWVQRLPYCRSVPCVCGYDEMYGHGVGMCQRGAIKMAERGASYKDILRHYYSGIRLSNKDEGPKIDGEKAPPQHDYKEDIDTKLDAIEQLAGSAREDLKKLREG